MERLFTEVTRDLLQRSDHKSVEALEKDLRNWVTAWNDNPKPFSWTKMAHQNLDSLSRLLQRTNGAGHQLLHNERVDETTKREHAVFACPRFKSDADYDV